MAWLTTPVTVCALLLCTTALPAWRKSPAPDAGAIPPSAARMDTSRPEQDSPRGRRSPISIDYHFRGGPARVGEPLTLMIRYRSKIGNAPIEVYYQSESPEGLSLFSPQPARVLLNPDSQGNYPEQEVVVVPLQSGRFYLQVSAGMRLEGRLLMRPLSIPVQVGSKAGEEVLKKSGAGEEGISLPARMD